MMKFDYLQPTTLEEASLLLTDPKIKAKLIAGGTEILVRMKEGKLSVDQLVSLANIDGLQTIREQGDAISLGAMTTLSDVEHSELIQRTFPVLFDGVEKVGSVQIRNVATIGGNLCNAAPCADTAPPLLVLDADISYWSTGEVKKKKLADFFMGPGITMLRPEDIMLGVHIGAPDPYSSGAYLKLSRRGGLDISMLGIAVQIRLDKTLSICEDAAIALGVAAPTPIRMSSAENILKGAKITESILAQAAGRASMDATPRDSIRCSSEYRRAMIKTLLPKVFNNALSRIRNQYEKNNSI